MKYKMTPLLVMVKYKLRMHVCIITVHNKLRDFLKKIRLYNVNNCWCCNEDTFQFLYQCRGVFWRCMSVDDLKLNITQATVKIQAYLWSRVMKNVTSWQRATMWSHGGYFNAFFLENPIPKNLSHLCTVFADIWVYFMLMLLSTNIFDTLKLNLSDKVIISTSNISLYSILTETGLYWQKLLF